MTQEQEDLYQQLELPNLSLLQKDDIPKESGTLSSKVRREKLRVRKNVADIGLSVVRGVRENQGFFGSIEEVTADKLESHLQRRQRLLVVRQKIEEALYVISDAELIINDEIQRMLLRINEMVQGAEKIKPGMARDFLPLQDYVTTTRSKKRPKKTEEPK